MKIRTKLIFAFSVVTLMTLGVSVLAYLQIQKLSSGLYEIGVVRLPSIEGLTAMREAMVELDTIADLPADAEVAARREKAWRKFKAGRELYEPLPQTKEEKGKWLAFAEAANLWAKEYAEGAGGKASAERHARAVGLIDEVIGINSEIVSDVRLRTVASREDSERVQRTMCCAAVIALIGAVAVGLLLGRGITRPIADITASLENIARGDLNSRIETSSQDELGDVARATNRMAEELSLSEARLKSISDNLPADMVYQVELKPDGQTRFIYVSEGVRRLHGVSPVELAREPDVIFNQIVQADRPRLLEARADSLAKMSPLEAVVRIRRKDGEMRWVHLSSAPRRLQDGRVIWDGVARDVTSIKRAEEQIECLQTVTREIANAEDFAEALRVILKGICERSGWKIGQAWVVEEDGEHLVMTASWVQGGAELEEFRRLSEGLRLKRGVSVPGIILEKKTAVWMRDVTMHPFFSVAVRREAALRAGIRGVLGVPILSGSEVIAVLEFGMTEVRDEEPFFVDLTSAVAAQIGLAMQRKRAEEMVRESRAQLRALAGRLQAVREEERTRIAREIHDILAQDLTRLKIDVDWVSKRLPAICKDRDVQPVIEKLQSVTEVTDSAIVTVQKIASELRPVVLDSLGLAAAIEWQAEEIQQRTGIQCDAIVSDEDFELDAEAQTNIFRIVQESLTNVVRHAKASKIEVILERNEKGLLLMVQDNGVGYDSSRVKDRHSLGLLGMRERALMMDGEFEIRGRDGEGTQVRVTFPLDATGRLLSSNKIGRTNV